MDGFHIYFDNFSKNFRLPKHLNNIKINLKVGLGKP